MTVAAVVALLFLSQVGTYLARRYRLTRTVFRGLRLRQTGSALGYSIYAAGWWILAALTLGLGYPFTRAALERFKMRNTFFGDLGARFDAKGGWLFLRVFPIWLAVAVPASVTIVSLAQIRWRDVLVAMPGAGSFLARAEAVSPGFTESITSAAVSGAVCLAMIALLVPWFHAIIIRWWISGIRFGEIATLSHLPARNVYAAYLRFAAYVFVFVLAIAVMTIAVFPLIGLIFDGRKSQISEIVTVLLFVTIYFISVFGSIALYHTTVALPVWRNVADTIELVGDRSRLERVHAAGEASSPLGEGIADVLNVGGL
jgi:uncharacterized membrane protein YjgN (DUF898 family)